MIEPPRSEALWNGCMYFSWKEKIAIIGVAISFAGAADASTKQCYGCSDYEMHVYASSQIETLRQTGPLYMVDSERGVVRKFAFFSDQTAETNPEFDPINHWVDQVPVEAEITKGITEFHQMAKALPSELVIPECPGCRGMHMKRLIGLTYKQI